MAFSRMTATLMTVVASYTNFVGGYFLGNASSLNTLEETSGKTELPRGRTQLQGFVGTL